MLQNFDTVKSIARIIKEDVDNLRRDEESTDTLLGRLFGSNQAINRELDIYQDVVGKFYNEFAHTLKEHNINSLEHWEDMCGFGTAMPPDINNTDV
jgi:predicted solute-binding protein